MKTKEEFIKTHLSHCSEEDAEIGYARYKAMEKELHKKINEHACKLIFGGDKGGVPLIKERHGIK